MVLVLSLSSQKSNQHRQFLYYMYLFCIFVCEYNMRKEMKWPVWSFDSESDSPSTVQDIEKVTEQQNVKEKGIIVVN